MSPEQMAKAVESYIKEAQHRLKGAEQYYDRVNNTQYFEAMPFNRLVEYAQMELYDLTNYALMLSIRIKRMDRELKAGLEREISSAVAVWMARNLALNEAGGLEPTEDSDLKVVNIDGRWTVTLDGEEVEFDAVSPEIPTEPEKAKSLEEG